MGAIETWHKAVSFTLHRARENEGVGDFFSEYRQRSDFAECAMNGNIRPLS